MFSSEPTAFLSNSFRPAKAPYLLSKKIYYLKVETLWNCYLDLAKCTRNGYFYVSWLHHFLTALFSLITDGSQICAKYISNSACPSLMLSARRSRNFLVPPSKKSLQTANKRTLPSLIRIAAVISPAYCDAKRVSRSNQP